MFPVLFEIGPVKIYSYGLFMALAFLVGSFVVWKKAKEEAFDEGKIFDGIIITTFFGLMGARLHFILFHFEHFGFDIIKWLWLTRYVGLYFYGGLFGGVLGLFWFTRRQKWDFWQIADIVVFGFSLAQIVAKIGCFFNKKDFTQIYEAILVFFIFYLLLKLERKYRLFDWYRGKKDKAEPGFLSLFYLILYSFSRIILENWREDGIYLIGIKITQIISVLILVFALIALYLRSGREIGGEKKLFTAQFLSLFDKIKKRMKITERKTRKKSKARIKVGKDIK